MSRIHAQAGALLAGLPLVALVLAPLSSLAAESTSAAAGGRQLEELLVTAEKREASVQDTSISITAFDGDFLQDFGVRNQEDLANFIPATTVQPYDIAIRGVGRSFRALGGDPGVSTYYDGVYSEDFGIASTEGGLYDVERIEVLRGPQGTLYGRNAVGGAINFITKRPQSEFSGEIKVNVGDYGLVEYYGHITGPVVEDLLNFRFNGVRRERDAYYQDVQPGNPGVGDYGDENYVLSFELNPSEDLEFYIRTNERSYRRRMGGAGITAGILVVNDGGGSLVRDTSSQVFGYRSLLRSDVAAGAGLDLDALAGMSAAALTALTYDDDNDPATAEVPVLNTATVTERDYYDQTSAVEALTSRAGVTSLVQRLRPGIDYAADDEPNRAFGCGTSIVNCRVAPVVGNGGLTGDDLKTATNGQHDEFFDHQNLTFQATWDFADWVSVKYIHGYTDYFYDRTTDRDLTSNPDYDETYYVSQGNFNYQHEFQFLFDFGEFATFTSGFFYYEARITQRGDFYSEAVNRGTADASNPESDWYRYGNAANYGPAGAVLGAVFQYENPDNLLFSGRDEYYRNRAIADPILARLTTEQREALTASDARQNPALLVAQGVVSVDAAGNILGADGSPTVLSLGELRTIARNDVHSDVGLWLGEGANTGLPCTGVSAGPTTCGTFLEYETSNDVEAFAFYNQAEFFLSDQFSLTLGLRYAEDKKVGEESVFQYTESPGENADLSANPLNFGIEEVLALISTANPDQSACLVPGCGLLNPAVPVLPINTLTGFNAFVAATDQSGELNPTRLRGVPVGISFYRPVSRTFDAITWRANLDWEPNDTTLVYGGITTGYRAGGFNLVQLSDEPSYDSEEVIAYELGWKDQLLDKTLQVSASIYLYDYENLHQNAEGQSSALGVVNNIVPVPEAEVRGLELEALWLATDALTLGGNFSYTDSEFTSDITGPQDYDGDRIDDVTSASLVVDFFNPNCPPSVSPTQECLVNITGNQFILVPKYKWTLYGIFNIPMGTRGDVELFSTVSFTDDVFFSLENNPLDKADSYYRWDVRANWTAAGENIVVSAFVNNILDEIGVRQISRYSENQNYLRSATPTDPRLLGLEFTYKFGAF